jgi:FimV-like protein
MLRLTLLIGIFFSSQIFAEILLSSPKLSVNANGERVVEFKIQNEDIKDQDIILKEYKSDDLLDKNYIAYTLLEDFSNYQSFSIVIKNNYEGNYFSFKLVIKDALAKDIFIFLPSSMRGLDLDYKEPVKRNEPKIKPRNIVSKKTKPEQVILEKAEEINSIVKADEITTMWSIASGIQKNSSDLSIYQVMWSIYLGNKDAFINGNINLIRKDKDLIIPIQSSMAMISDKDARGSIIAMNKSFALSFAPAAKSLLILTAPKIKKDLNTSKTSLKSEDRSQEKVISLDNEEINDPKNFIENNTKQLGISMESKVAQELVKEVESIEQTSSAQNDFGLTDLLFVALISVLSGILIALIYIQLNSRKTKKIEYDFDEARDSGSSIQGLPKGLSIENNADEQQLDLAVTYFEMGDLDNCKNILIGLIQNTEDETLKSSAQNLFDKI